MNDFSNEINEIYKLADVQLNEEQGYFTDWKSIKEKVVERYIDARLDETGMLEYDDWYIQYWLERNASADLLEKLYDICGENKIEWVASYINKNPNEGGIITQVAKGMAGEYFDSIANQIQKEFEQNNLIYRMIDSNKSPKEIAQILKTNGTGNCWAKQEENAKAYYGNGNYNEYCLIGEATMDNVNWEATIFLRMMAENENEVRLRKDSPIHIVGIKYYHYDEDNKLDKKDYMKIDMMLSAGHSYVFEESKQPIVETIKKVNEGFADTRLITTVAELDAYLRNNTETRVVYDKVKKWFLVGNSETSIHMHLLNDALADGYYEPFEHNGKTYTGKENEYEGGLWLHRLNPSRFILLMVSQDPLNSEEYYYDDYKYCYHYPNYCVFDRRMDFEQTPLFKYLGKPLEIENFGDFEDYDEDQYIDESIAFVSKKDLSDIILKNPTKRELRENNLTLCRCIEDSEGNWYFTDMENMLHAYVVYELRDEAAFPLFDGNDCYGIAYYDAESNEFWYNLNDYMYRKECIEQYNNSEYLRTTFPNAKIIPNPWNNQMYDELYDDEDEEQLDEQLLHMEKSHYEDYYAVILKNPSRKELRDNGLKRARFISYENGTWIFFDAMQWIHEQIYSKYHEKYGQTSSMGFYDYDTNEFIFIEDLATDKDGDDYNEAEYMYYENKNKNWLMNQTYIINNFGTNFKVNVYGDWVDNPW